MTQPPGQTPDTTPDVDELPADAPVSDPVIDDDTAAPEAPAKPRTRIILCPYCGHAQSTEAGARCQDCGGLFEPLSRRATQIAMGPWYLRDKSNPFRPGCSYDVLTKMIAAGRITPTTVMRGPTTRQFWSIARNVPGIAHHLGICHKCSKHVDPQDKFCPQCHAPFKAVKTRNELGLMFPHRRAAEAAQRSLNRLLGIAPPPPSGELPPEGEAATAEELSLAARRKDRGQASPTALPGAENDTGEYEAQDDAVGDLLDDVLGPQIGAAGRQRSVEPLDFTPQSDAEDAALLASSSPAPRHTTAPPPRPATEPAWDAAPKVEAPAAYNPAALPPRQGISPLVWVLIGANVLVAAAVIVYLLVSGGSGS